MIVRHGKRLFTVTEDPMKRATVAAATVGLARICEAAEYLSVSRSKLYLMMDGGELPYVKLGKSRRISWAELARLVKRRSVTAQSKR